MQVNTNENTLIAKIVGLVIAVVIVGMVLVPFVTEATTTEKTFENDGFYTMDKIDDTSEKTIVWDTTKPTTLTVDGYDVDFSTFATNNLSYTIVGSEVSMIRFIYKTDGTTQMHFLGSGFERIYATSSTLTTITISAGTMTITSDAEGFTDPTLELGTDCYAINGNGTGDSMLVMKNSAMPAYVKGDSTVKLIGVISGSSDSRSVAIYSTGNLNDGMEITTVYKGAWSSVTYSDPTPTYTEVKGFNDLYSLEKYEFVESISGQPDTNVLFTYFLVPASVTAELSQHPSNIEITLYQMIPILVVLGLIVGIVGLLAYNRYGN